MLFSCSRRIALFSLAALVVSSATQASAADWPQFQGPGRNGVSPETGLARNWPETGPRVHWTFPLAEGFAGPAIRDGEVYVLDRVNDEQDVLRCLSLDSGEELWTYAYDAPGSVGHSGSRTTPTVTEKHVFTVGMLGNFYCIDRVSHQPVWSKNLLDEFPQDGRPRWGYSQSPSVHGDLVIVAPQSKEGFVAAFKQSSGELVWTSDSLGLTGYSTPAIITLGGVEQVVMIGASNQEGTEKGWVGGISLEDGTLLWKYNGWQCWIPIAYPTLIPNDRLFLTGGYDAGSAIIQISRDGGKWQVEELFRTDACGSQIHQPLVYKDHLYVNSNSNERSDGMMCLTFDGEVLWNTVATEGLPNFERGNLLIADGMIISLDGKTGVLHLVEPSPEGFQEIAKAKMFDGDQMWSPMALSKGRLVLRSQTEMKCIDLRNP
ncbi:MAG: PQQ-binding-like beta-propeller repeat protein [Candidatus Hydrogenedentes bacterium]|nr:PQQ-binding-like beta-propeller repeat protein [Candidatus Hydrogenedentota bacterium]